MRKEWVFEKKEKEIEEEDRRTVVDEKTKKPVLDEGGSVQSQVIGTRKRKIFKEEKNRKTVDDRPFYENSNIFSWRFHPRKISVMDEYAAIEQEVVSFQAIKDMQAESVRIGAIR